jgi:hypothetical protein
MSRVWPERTFFHRATWHFHRRALERHGVTLEPGEYTKILRQIARGKAQKLETRKGKLPAYRVVVTRDGEQKTLPVVYDPKHTRLVTALSR